MLERMKALSHSRMVEELRPLVGDNGWDYGILWKLSQDQRYLEWMGCCCCGAEASIENGGRLFFGGSSAKKSPCRDLIFQHPRTMACDALSEFPSSVPLDSCLGIYARVLMSNQCTWQTIHPAGSTSLHETVGAQTRVLVPIPGGLVELFVSKHVPEDQQTIDFVMSQCNATSYEQATADFLDESCDYTSKNKQWMSADNQNFQWDPSLADQSQLYNSPLNLFDGSMGVQVQLDLTIDNAAYQQSLMKTGQCLQQPGTMGENSLVVGQEKESVKQEAAQRGDSGSEGSEDDEETRPLGRNGKRHHSKNLMAERKRRKKLNDRLYALRALVPKITKMDRASILGDAIEHVMELQKQVKDLQDELEKETDFEDSDAKQIESNYEMDKTNPNGTMMMMSAAHGMELEESPNSTSARMATVNVKMTDSIKPSPEQSNTEEKGHQMHQMEPQVEVRQLEANEFYLKVFCEQKMGGFARLMEAMSTLGLEVTSVTVTTLQTLVLNVFRVQKRDNDMMQVEQVRDSLLELTRGPTGGWAEPGLAAANGGGDHQHDNRYRRRSHHLSSLHQLH